MFVLHTGGDRTRVAVTCKKEVLEVNTIIYYVAQQSQVEASLHSEIHA